MPNAEPIALRPYQVESIEALRAGIRAGHRAQVLVAPTGAGKTVCASYLLREVQSKGTKAAFIVDRVALCSQTSGMLWKYGIDHGMAQSDNTFNRQAPIQICSAQTIEKRGFFPDLDVLIIDECHTQRKVITEFAQKARAKVIGLTATPFSKGMGETYTNVVNVTTTDKLIIQGYLAPLKVYAAKQIDMTGAKTVAGEWADREVETRGRAIIGDIVSEWFAKTDQHFGKPVKTIVFSATVAHGEEICRQFQAAGVNFQQVSYRDGNDQRRADLIDEFRKSSSSIMGLVSCEALAKGFDVPDVMCGICARPYRRSFSAHIQMLGRVMRQSPGKEFALWLDHAGNYLGFYPEMEDLFANGVSALDNGEREKTIRKEVAKEMSELVCSCGYILKPSMDSCPACGKSRVRRNGVVSLPGEMFELTKPKLDPPKPYLARPREVIWKEICHVAIERKKGDIEAATRFAKAQYMNFFSTWPPFAFGPADSVDPRLKSHITANVIRYAKARKSA